MGTPRIAARILEALAERHTIAEAITRPDAISARGSKTDASPVKKVALEHDIPVFEIKSLREPDTIEHIKSLKPDVICVVAYGAILPPEILSIPAYGCINVHASLLPRWRGAAPMERALLAGDKETGVSIMRIEEGLDTGPYCLQRSVSLEGKSLPGLVDELADEGAKALLEALSLIEAGTVEWHAQPADGITYAPKIAKNELDISLEDDALTIERKVRASSEAHACHARIAGKDVILENASVAMDENACTLTESLTKGQARFAQKRLLLKTVQGTFEVHNLKPHGKRSMDARAFCAGIQGAKKSILTWENPQ